jgi:O-antigen ligase
VSSAPAPIQGGWGFSGEDRASRARRVPRIPPASIIALSLVIAVVAGRFFADGRMTLGAALVLGVCLGPLAFFDLTLGLALYVAILFIQDTEALSIGPNTIAVLVLLGWLGTVVTRSARQVVLREQSRLLLVLGLFGLWLTLSLLWSQSPGQTAIALETWLLALLAFVLTITAVRSPRDVAYICVAFIVGALASVAFGVATGGLTAVESTSNEATLDGRFTGGGGDPNKQAAGYLIAMFLCAGLWGLARRPRERVALLVGFVVVAIGFFATQSRGGLIALGIAAISGLVLLPRQRKRLLGLTGAAGIGLAIVAVANPSAIQRMTDLGGGSSGRSDLWKVAWQIFKRHPVDGIGLNAFEAIEPHYALQSGTLTRAALVAEVPHLVHNVYLQLLTETGLVGFALFFVVIIGCLRTSWLAAKVFDARGHAYYGDLARAVLMASIAMLAAQFFISDGDDWRLWILLGLGPVLFSLARRVPVVSATQSTRAPLRAAIPRVRRGLARRSSRSMLR